MGRIDQPSGCAELCCCHFITQGCFILISRGKKTLKCSISLIQVSLTISTIAIAEAFRDLPDLRRGAGRRHEHALCLALFTLAVSAGCRGFISISDWLDRYQGELLAIFRPAKNMCIKSSAAAGTTITVQLPIALTP